MLKKRHQPVNLFDLVPQLGLGFEPQLEQLDRLLDDDELIELVRRDLARQYPKTRLRGRPSTPVEVILRMLVVMYERRTEWATVGAPIGRHSVGLPRQATDVAKPAGHRFFDSRPLRSGGRWATL